MRFLYAVVGVACTAFAAFAATPDPKPIWVAPVAQPSFTTIPPGYHSHTTTDGRTIVHHDSNRGNADAHEGIDRPWNKSGYAGQTVAINPFAVAADCPNGVCPTGARISVGERIVVRLVSGSTVRTSERAGPFRRLFARLRGLRSAGGCP